MNLEKITSLADLVFKAKTNKYYKQLAIIAARHFVSTADGDEIPETYEQSIIVIAKVTLENDPNSCSDVVDAINCYRYDVKEDRPPTPKNKTRWYDDCNENPWVNRPFNNRYYNRLQQEAERCNRPIVTSQQTRHSDMREYGWRDDDIENRINR